MDGLNYKYSVNNVENHATTFNHALSEVVGFSSGLKL